MVLLLPKGGAAHDPGHGSMGRGEKVIFLTIRSFQDFSWVVIVYFLRIVDYFP